MTQRIGDYIQTYSGHQFWPLDPAVDEVFIEDIAHALSMTCRYCGHCLRFYSVAEHCVLMARYIEQPYKLWALLHDASEAYIADVSRPVKKDLCGYQRIEANLMYVILKRYGLDQGMPVRVKEVDNSMLLVERRQNMRDTPWDWKIEAASIDVRLQFWTPEKAKFEFLQMFAELTNAT